MMKLCASACMHVLLSVHMHYILCFIRKGIHLERNGCPTVQHNGHTEGCHDHAAAGHAAVLALTVETQHPVCVYMNVCGICCIEYVVEYSVYIKSMLEQLVSHACCSSSSAQWCTVSL
jgi:hypothetical protein